MSCGKPHETDCSEVLAEVWLFLDHECDGQRRELLQKHLEECSPCLEQFGIEEHLKVLLARKCGGEHAPEALKQRLREKIRKTVVVEQTIVTVQDGTDAP
ncbi:MAG TPA: mycothiol system anti-sigma-R factor [Actinophytocola sp.]|uniref:mycothiol system anti-sigma-R factor n=1 Tax=Actinophytocola sp. TaxID=1872138 RepID=UPI002F950FBA